MKKVIALACACAAMAPLPAAASARTTHHIGTRTSAPAVLGTAPLLRPAQLGQLQRLLHGGVDVRVVEHDERSVAAELHRQSEQVRRGLLHELATDLG